MTSTLRGHGLALTVHDGWEARIWMPDLPPPAENHPVVRLANFALPATKNTYAEDIADDLRPGSVVASLAEFAPRLADRGLYAPQGVPAFGLADLDPRAVQRRLPERSGAYDVHPRDLRQQRPEIVVRARALVGEDDRSGRGLVLAGGGGGLRARADHRLGWRRARRRRANRRRGLFSRGGWRGRALGGGWG